tara:strand:+ start:1034 stop:1294 length:261 start_codon:yes stop_codon:yes gene_type:complete
MSTLQKVWGTRPRPEQDATALAAAFAAADAALDDAANRAASMAMTLAGTQAAMDMVASIGAIELAVDGIRIAAEDAARLTGEEEGE